ncbi:PASTA domain-containing protein [Eggerthellaceae bacterium 24-137]
MKCPHCSYDNLDDAPFCEQCGHVFLSSDRVPEVPDPADLERRRGEALDSVPPIVQVPDIAPADTTGVIRPRPSVPEVVPDATGPLGRSSVADLADPLPEPPREPDFSGFERLVDSSYVPPAATAGDTAEIPVIRDEYVPHARNYTLGLSPREQRKRDREQRKLEKKFAKAQRKEEAKAAKEAAREAERAEREAARAAEEKRRAAALAEQADVTEPTVSGSQSSTPTGDTSASTTGAVGTVGATQQSGSLPLCDNAPEASGDSAPGLPASQTEQLPAATAALPVADLDAVLMTGDGVVSLFENSTRRRARSDHQSGPLELPGAEQGIVVAGERGIESACGQETTSLGPSDLAVAGERSLDATAPDDAKAEGVAPATPLAPTASAATKEAAVNADESAPKAAANADAAAPQASTVSSTRKTGGSSASRGSASVSAPRPKRSKAPVVIAAVAALAIALLLVAGGTYMAEIWGGKTLPDVVGLSQDEATAALADKGFGAEVTEVKSDEAAGTVLSETPGAGARVEEGATIALEVAIPRVIPAVKGMTRDEAVAALEAEGFTAIEYKEKKSNKAEDTVLKVSPKAETEAVSTEPITLTIAVPYTVPDVEGLDAEAAKQALADEGYEVTKLWSYTEDVPEGTALSTDPEAGTQFDTGSDVTLYIAKSRAAELVGLAESFLPGARLKNADGRYIIDSVQSVTYAGDNVVRYTCEAHQYEDVVLPFGRGTTRVEDDKRVTLEGSLTFNDDNEVTTADPAIKY